MPARIAILLSVCVCARASLLTSKEFICKDPDTGTLHAVNSTWRSTTFCGNYTCKIRSKNTSSDTPPASKIIVNLSGPQARIPDNDTPENKTENKHGEFSLFKILPDLSKDNDRYLNTAEINKITELLRTVKKSDLLAVIELYNVAQEIYKGMKDDVNDINDPIEDYDSSGRARGSESKSEDLTRSVDKKVSYWYDPVNGYKKDGDMKSEGSEYKTTTTYPAIRPDEPYFYAKRNSRYPSYFSGTLLTHDDFGRLGYYNPQAYFQGMPSYQRYPTSAPQNMPCIRSPCAYQYQTPGAVNPTPRPAYPLPPTLLHPPPPALRQPPPPPVNTVLHPYPSSYNYSTHPYNHYTNYYKGNPWAYYDYHKNLPYQIPRQVQQSPIISNAEVPKEEPKVDEEKNTAQDEKSWKTDPLSEAVINEIRANIAERGKLLNIPLKKRIKLERAAKVIKLDQFHNSRKTRSVSNDSMETISILRAKPEDKEENTLRDSEVVQETYIERVTCAPSMELGFFRIGNMTRPYPHCCPEKIEDNLREGTQTT